MNTEQMLAEIREANLSYLMLAQSLIRSDRDQALYRLGISEDTATLIGTLSPAQIMKIAAGKLEHAAAYADRALQASPLHGPSLYTLAFALSGRGELDRAFGVLTELQRGAGRDSLQAEAPELVPVAMIELERLRRLRNA